MKSIGAILLILAGIGNSYAEPSMVIRSSELDCLAKNIYFEARNQPVEGMYAVASVTINRMVSSKFPNTICSVVKQPAQFSWYWDGLSDTPKDQTYWIVARTVAEVFLINYYNVEDKTEGALFYHAYYSKPIWRHKLLKTIQIGDHIFYKNKS